MWKLVESASHSNVYKTDGSTTEAFLGRLEEMAEKFHLSSPREGVAGGELAWCTGITPDRFKQDTGNDEIDAWNNESEDRCWDISVRIDDELCLVSADFEGFGLLQHSNGSRNAKVPGVQSSSLDLGASPEEAALRFTELLADQLDQILRPCPSAS